jgi:hypothetical protein
LVEEAKVSTRGLTEGGTPLRHFKGRLNSFPKEAAKNYAGTIVQLNFTDVDVIESLEPYPFPIATIGINLSNNKKSKWGIFSESLNKLIPESEDIDQQVGKMFEMKMTPGHKVFQKPRDAAGTTIPGGKSVEVETEAWEVIALEGAVVAGKGTSAPAEIAKALLDGKNQADFNRLAYGDAVIRTDPNLLRSLGDNSFVTAQVQMGAFVKDANGVFHKVK